MACVTYMQTLFIKKVVAQYRFAKQKV